MPSTSCSCLCFSLIGCDSFPDPFLFLGQRFLLTDYAEDLIGQEVLFDRVLALSLHETVNSVDNLIEGGVDCGDVPLFEDLRRLENRILGFCQVQVDIRGQVAHILHFICLLDHFGDSRQ